MPVQHTLQYNQGTGGFSETFYIDSPTLDVGLPLQDIGVQVLKTSLALRAPGTQIYGWRQSLIGGTTRQSYLTKFNNKYVVAPGTPLRNPDVITTDALVYMWDSSHTHKRPFAFRGIQDNDSVRSLEGLDTPTPELLVKIKNYLQALWGAGAVIRLTDTRITAPTQPFSVTSITPNSGNPNISRIQIVGPATYIEGEQVEFFKIPKNDAPGFPRVAKILTTSAGSPTLYFDIPYRLRSSGGQVLPTGMGGRRLVYRYFAFGQPSSQVFQPWQFWKFSEHKTGRPFGVPRGRARVAIKAQ